MSSEKQTPQEPAVPEKGKAAAATAGKEGKKKDKEAKDKRVSAKAPRGTRDFHPEDMRSRTRVMQIVSSVYERHGAVQIETPTFELTEVLTGKYGDEGQALIYNLERKNEAHESLSLRYDLTVPFARYLATYNVTTMKRYQLGRVFRREEVAAGKGRYREFYQVSSPSSILSLPLGLFSLTHLLRCQCDFDYAGVTEPMVADAESVAILCEQLRTLGLAPFIVKVSNRALLEELLAMCGVPQPARRTVCSSIDKLDKHPWAEVRTELVDTKKVVPADVADRIGVFSAIHGEPRSVLARVRGLFEAAKVPVPPVLPDMELLAGYLEALGCAGDVQFDMSLARGLDYYTGCVFEAVLVGEEVGSVAGGGRYDNLLGMFRKGAQIPTVGFALGIERVFDIIAKREAGQRSRPAIDVVVFSLGPGIVKEKLAVCKSLWAAGIRAELDYSPSDNIGKKLKAADSRGVPVAVAIGETDVKDGSARVKFMATREQVSIKFAEITPIISKYLSALDQAPAPAASSSTAAPAAATTAPQPQSK